MKDLSKMIGIGGDGTENAYNAKNIQRYINLKISVLGADPGPEYSQDPFFQVASEFEKILKERDRLLPDIFAPSDQRIQEFINDYFSSVKDKYKLNLPSMTFVLDFYGLARELSLPLNKNEYVSEYVHSYRVKQGILHNPKNDRRTTKGVFHVVEGGLPIPDDKKAVPMQTAAFLLEKALTETGDIMTLPYSAGQSNSLKTWVSLLLRPTVVPEVQGVSPRKSMEIRFFAPGSLVSNLDFVESIFGNAGNPFYLRSDAGLDADHWIGHTGCIILAPQLINYTKKEAGLPPFNQATERQKRDGMCWMTEDELYNDGQPFKITFRDEKGVIVTVIADNYFGYSKKEVKTQISYSANLAGNAEEEHAGGAFIFQSYSQGDMHISKNFAPEQNYENMIACMGDKITLYKEGYAVDKKYPHIFYIPETAMFEVPEQRISWEHKGLRGEIKLLPGRIYVMPNGSKYIMEKVTGAQNYRLVETYGEGTVFHKPATVSGGGKSEISKSVNDSILTGSFFINDFEKDFEAVKEIIERDYSDRLRVPKDEASRPFLSNRRSMGSVIKLLTPSAEYTDAYNAWLMSVPQYVKGLAFIIKRFYQAKWGHDWKKHFSVDIMNGQPGNELKYKDKKIVTRYLRVGFDSKGLWRTFKLRQDFIPAVKLQLEDDISASTVVPVSKLSNLSHFVTEPSVKIVENCEYRFFQRPDEAIHPGYDKQAESDLASPNTFISNFEPLTPKDAKAITEDVVNFDRFTQPMHDLIEEVAKTETPDFFVSSAQPRLVDGKPSKNVRYLQTRGDLINDQDTYLAEVGMRIARNLPFDKPLYAPVNIVISSRRNNPSEPGIRPLAVYSPLHYQELPELFMDFVCSLTGKSPSTTGAGSEGALTKGPFNALLPIVDMNNALMSYIITGYAGFTTPAGHIGSKYRVDHDLSLLIPELWSRLSPEERLPEHMIKAGYLEKINDFEHNGKLVKASILGYRITQEFVNGHFGRVFENPNVVLTEEMLKPELQDMDEFVDGVNNIVESQQKVALSYFKDGSIDQALPQMKVLLNIMAYGNYEGKDLSDPELRKMFTREYVLNSPEYKARLEAQQKQDLQVCKMQIDYTEKTLDKYSKIDPVIRKEIQAGLDILKKREAEIKSPDYMKHLVGMIGKDPMGK